MTQKFTLDPAGSGYIPEIAIRCSWEVVVEAERLYIIQRGGPLEPMVLEVSVDKEGFLAVEDWWGWGNG